MKEQFEQRILAYLDGSLSEAESERLLAEVAQDEDKLALFESHLGLERLIEAARVPLETPMEVHRSLAEKIPAMVAFLPQLFGAAQTIPILTQSANPFAWLLSKMSVSTAIGIGTSVALLTTTAVVVTNNMNSQDAPKAPASVRVAQAPEHRLPELSNSAQTLDLSHSRATVSTEEATAGFKGQTSRGVSNRQYSTTIGESADDALRSGRASSHNAAQRELDKAGSADPSTNDGSARSASRQKDADEEIASIKERPSLLASNEAPQYLISAPGLHLMPGSDMEVESEPIHLRPFLFNSFRMIRLPRVLDNGVSAHGMKFEDAPSIGLDVQFSSHFAARIQAGNGAFAQIQPFAEISNDDPFLTRLTYGTKVSLTRANFTLLGVAYTPNPTDDFKIRFDASGGAAWLKPAAPLAHVGMAGEYGLSNSLSLFGGLSMESSWVKGQPETPQAPSGNTIVWHHELDRSSLRIQSAGLEVGVRFHY